MDKNVWLTLTGRQRNPEDGESVTELTADALYYERDGGLYILYEETAEDGSKTKNRIKLKDLLLEVTKKGAVDACMIFETGKEHTIEYATPFGILRMGILTHSVEVDQSDDRLTVAADYTLTGDGREISQCKIFIKIQNKV